MPTEQTWNPNTKQYDTRETISGGQVSTDLAAASRATTAGKGRGALEIAGRKPMPKQEPGQSASEFGEVMRKYRTEQDSDPANQAQKKVLTNMSAGDKPTQ